MLVLLYDGIRSNEELMLIHSCTHICFNTTQGIDPILYWNISPNGIINFTQIRFVIYGKFCGGYKSIYIYKSTFGLDVKITSGVGTLNLSGAPTFTPNVCFLLNCCGVLSTIVSLFCYVSFDHCIVCLSIYGFRLWPLTNPLHHIGNPFASSPIHIFHFVVGVLLFRVSTVHIGYFDHYCQ